MNTFDRMNVLTRESAETALDTATFVQRQNAQLFESWLATVETSQKAARELTLKAIEQVQQAQALWFELLEETFDKGIDNVTLFTQNGLKETSETINKVSRQVKTETKPVETAAK